jgi:hypothetical protein
MSDMYDKLGPGRYVMVDGRAVKMGSELGPVFS